MCRVGTQAAFPGDAAHNDLLLSKSMNNLDSDTISKSVLKAFSNYTWYLMKQLVLLSHFNKSVCNNKKHKMLFSCTKKVLIQDLRTD